MVRWTGDFCPCRYASVIIGGYESEAREVEYTGIPQGSPLWPLLYIFYNADLVERKIFKHGDIVEDARSIGRRITGVFEEV